MPALFAGKRCIPASELLDHLKAHPALRPLLRGSETLEYGAHLVPEGGLHSMPAQYAGEGWLLVGDALRTCVNTGFTVRGMDMALIGAQAAAQTLILACQHGAPQNLFTQYHQEIERSLLWDVLQRYRHVPAAAAPRLVSPLACADGRYLPRTLAAGRAPRPAAAPDSLASSSPSRPAPSGRRSCQELTMSVARNVWRPPTARILFRPLADEEASNC
jgi:hypothetical protein